MAYDQEEGANPFAVYQKAKEDAYVNEVLREVETSLLRMPKVEDEPYVVWEARKRSYLTEVALVSAEPPMPEEVGPRTIIPVVVASPTAKLVSEQNGTGYGSPWTTGPRSSMLLAPVILGTMLVTVGKRVLLAVAYAGAQEVGQRLLYQATSDGIKRNLKMMFRTGRGPGRGRYVRPRPASGEMAGQDSDPYDNENDFAWFNPWTWF